MLLGSCQPLPGVDGTGQGWSVPSCWVVEETHDFVPGHMTHLRSSVLWVWPCSPVLPLVMLHFASTHPHTYVYSFLLTGTWVVHTSPFLSWEPYYSSPQSQVCCAVNPTQILRSLRRRLQWICFWLMTSPGPELSKWPSYGAPLEDWF